MITQGDRARQFYRKIETLPIETLEEWAGCIEKQPPNIRDNEKDGQQTGLYGKTVATEESIFVGFMLLLLTDWLYDLPHVGKHSSYVKNVILFSSSC